MTKRVILSIGGSEGGEDDGRGKYSSLCGEQNVGGGEIEGGGIYHCVGTRLWGGEKKKEVYITVWAEM